MHSIGRVAKALTALLLLSTPVFAIDGEILIDQARVNAGGLTPGDTPGFPATLGKSGRYKLAGNLKVPAGKDGIEVAAHDVTIDLNGFTISSKPPGQAVQAIVAQEMTGLKVTGGTITGFQADAIYNFNGMFSAVENMRIIANGGAGVLVGSESRVRSNTIANNGQGITCASCLVEQNVISGSTSGAGVFASEGGVALGNLIVSNTASGLVSVNATLGYGNNILVGNDGGMTQVIGPVIQLHANVCSPACP